LILLAEQNFCSNRSIILDLISKQLDLSMN
jgi:hypothetical protein